MRKQKSTLSGRMLQVIMGLVSIVIVIPVFAVVNYSFKTKRELILSNALELPKQLQWVNYQNAISRLNLGTTYLNTFLYTAISVTILAILASAAAWVIARNKGKLFKFFYVYFIIGLLIPFQALFLPIYIMGYTLHLTNTFYGIILMYVATGMSFSVFIMTSFMTQLPVELEEAACIDGCSVYRIFASIVMPLLMPAIATLIIMQAFLIWNDYLMASLFVSSSSLKTLNVYLQQFFSNTASDYGGAMAGIGISSLPIIILFVAMQKYFIKGLIAGAMKG